MPLLDRDARQLRELDVVANLNGDLATVGVEHLDAVASLHTPPVPLARRDMQLVLLAKRAVTAKQIGDVKQAVVLEREV